MKLIKILLIFSWFIIITHTTLAGEIITGKACYRFSDQESIAVARDIALSMAKRDALEGYAVFINATSTVENFKLKNDIISSISASMLRNLEIIEKSENLDKREVCRTIKAEVEEVEIQQRIVSQINIFHKKRSNYDTIGLPENNKIKLLKIVNSENGLIIIGLCKGKFHNWKDITSKLYVPTIRVTHYDHDGIPINTMVQGRICSREGNIVEYRFCKYSPLLDRYYNSYYVNDYILELGKFIHDSDAVFLQ